MRESVFYPVPEGYDVQPRTIEELAALEKRLGYPRDFSVSFNAAPTRLLHAIFDAPNGQSFKSVLRKARKGIAKRA